MKVFKQDDKVWSPIFGWGIVHSIDNSGMYPVNVRTNGNTYYFTEDGRYLAETGAKKCLFHKEYEIIEQEEFYHVLFYDLERNVRVSAEKFSTQKAFSTYWPTYTFINFIKNEEELE